GSGRLTIRAENRRKAFTSGSPTITSATPRLPRRRTNQLARQWLIVGSGPLPHRAGQVRVRAGRVDLCDRIDDAQGREEGHASTGLEGPGDFHQDRRTAEHCDAKPAAMEPSDAQKAEAPERRQRVAIKPRIGYNVAIFGGSI